MKKSTVVTTVVVTQAVLLHFAFLFGRLTANREAMIEAMDRTMNSVYSTVIRADSLAAQMDRAWPILVAMYTVQDTLGVD